MPYLGDYLGQLLAEIAMARVQADLETVRLAEFYATQPLLRTLPVPHVRLPDVDLDIPVLVKSSEEPRAGEPARGGAKLSGLAKKFEQILGVHMAKAGFEPSPADRKKLQAVLNDQIALYGALTEIAVSVSRIADDLTSAAVRAIGEFKPAKGVEKTILSSSFSTDLREAVRREFLKLRTAPPRLSVLVTSQEIREGGTAENVVRLRLKVSEQGMEWTTIESDGIQQDRLVPE